jgi:parallel beta-helix repeat protein
VGILLLVNTTPETVAPVITSSNTCVGNVDSPISYTATATDADEGDTLEWSLDSAPDGMTIDSSTGVVSYTPSSIGEETFTVRATDSYENYDTQVVTLTVSAFDGTDIDAAWLTANGPAPYLLTTDDEVYRLQTDVTVDATAFIVGGENQTLNLNNHTVTYGNASPVVVANGGFESGTGTSVPNWDTTGASDAELVAVTRGPWGSQELQFTDSSTEQVIISDDISIPTANRDYCLHVPMRGPSSGVASRIAIHDAADDTELAYDSKTSMNYGAGAECIYTPTNTNDVYIKCTFTPDGDGPYTWVIDEITLRHHADYGIVHSDATYGPYWPTQLDVSRVTTAMVGSKNFTLQGPGSLVQGASLGHDGWGVYAYSCDSGGTIDQVTSSQNGPDAGFLFGFYGAGTWSITDNTITSTVTKITNRTAEGHVIYFASAGDNKTITGNTISGFPRNGIRVRDGANHTISNNTLQGNGRFTNCYGIQINGIQDSEVNGNTITATNYGRGIFLEKLSGDADAINNVEVANNTITVRELANFEYGFDSLGTTGLRIRCYTGDGITNVNIHDNTITAYTDEGEAEGAVGMRVTLYGTWTADPNINVYDNEFKAIVETTNASYYATAYELADIVANAVVRATGNTFSSNHISQSIGGEDGAEALEGVFVGNTYAKVAEGAEVTHISIRAGYYVDDAEVTIISPTFTGGASSGLTYAGTGTKTMHEGWLLTVDVDDASGDPVVGATVSVEDTDSVEVASGTSDANGLVEDLEIVETTTTVVGTGTPSVDDRNDHTINVTAAGYQNYSQTETVDQDETHTAALTAS